MNSDIRESDTSILGSSGYVNPDDNNLSGDPFLDTRPNRFSLSASAASPSQIFHSPTFDVPRMRFIYAYCLLLDHLSN